MGVVSSLGLEVDTFYNALLDGRSGVSRIEVREPPRGGTLGERGF